MTRYITNLVEKGNIMELLAEDILKLVIAIGIGSVIGAEREYRDKSAGFRTLVFICVGSTLFTMLSLKVANDSDPARIAAQIVTGVGFLGAGTILRERGQIAGLTTAAMIWLTAALGMGVGSGNYLLSIVGTGVVLVVLWVFPFLEHWIDNMSGTEYYEIVCTHTPGRFEELIKQAQAAQLEVISSKRSKVNDNLIVALVVKGSPKKQDKLAAQLLSDPNIKEFRH
jgi:putative Mg2+ transporter-C (MgtC) family protein